MLNSAHGEWRISIQNACLNTFLSGCIISWYLLTDLFRPLFGWHWPEPVPNVKGLELLLGGVGQWRQTATKNVQKHHFPILNLFQPGWCRWRVFSVCAYPVCNAAWAAVVWRLTSWDSVGPDWPFAALHLAPSQCHLNRNNTHKCIALYY